MRLLFLILLFFSNVCTAADESPITARIMPIQYPDCLQNKLGTLEVNVTGGTAPYTYLWSNGETTSQIANIVGGNYSVIITDSNNNTLKICGNLDDISAPALSLRVPTITDPTCHGSEDGKIVLNTEKVYNYLWDDGSTDTSLANIGEGDHSVLISDGVCQTRYRYTLVAPTLLEAKVESQDDCTCSYRSDGQIFLHVCGGVEPYAYQWKKDGVPLSNTIANTLINLEVGNYEVTITDAIGCTVSVSDIEIGIVDELKINVSDKINVQEYGKAEGFISINVEGGTPPYTYRWSNGESNEAYIENLFVGCYDVMVIDMNGCSDAISDICIKGPSMDRSITLKHDEINSCMMETLMIEEAEIKNVTQFEWTCLGGGTFEDSHALNPIFHPDAEAKEITLVLCGHNYSEPDIEYSDTLVIKLTQNLDVDLTIPNEIKMGSSVDFSYEIYGGSGDYLVKCSPDSIIADHVGKHIYTTELKGEQALKLVVTDNQNGCQFVDSLKLTPTLEEKDGVDPVNWISPNNDGYNDSFVINGIDKFPSNFVSIFNRWGDLLVKYKDYDNSIVAWDGTNSSGKRVVNGTYFFIIEAEKLKPVSGWIQVVSSE